MYICIILFTVQSFKRDDHVKSFSKWKGVTSWSPFHSEAWELQARGIPSSHYAKDVGRWSRENIFIEYNDKIV